jgi:outer membrane protein OmpA-like peptidoglycan-associated protein
MPPRTGRHDVDELGFVPRRRAAAQAQAPVEEETVAAAPARQVEVRLLEAKWKPGQNGFQFTEECLLEIKAEFLQPTVRKRVEIRPFVVFNGQEEDLGSPVDAFLDNNGLATARIPLEYGSAYYEALEDDPTVTCQYKCRLSHSTGEREIESELLDMPATQKIAVDFVEIADIHFHHNCALPCLDENGDLIASLLSAFSFAKEHTDRELVVEGHADRSGDETYNLHISKRRAEAIKALLENNDALWKGVVDCDGHDQKIETEDYQQTLKSLAVKYGWPCDPGAVDNKYGPKTQTAAKSFQSEYNTRFPGNEQLTLDGKIGPKSWQAIFHTLRDLLDKALTSAALDPPPALTYGYPDGDGIYPCGESSPVTDLEKSEEDRRVELVFYKTGEWSPAIEPAPGRSVDRKKDPVSEKEWEKTPVEPGAGTDNGAIPRIKIDKLDKWFIPGPADKGGETCVLKYTLGDADAFTGKLVFEVFASNYCNAEMKADYSVAFSALGNPIPIYSQEMPAEKAEAGKQHEITDWNGKSTAAEGALKPRQGQDRYINVAFSPYTIHFRCSLDEADKDARIDLKDFWPRWNTGTGAVENDSLKVTWKILKSQKLKAGKLLIVDKADTEAFTKDLAEADLSEGDHEFAWDGSLTAGGQLSKDNMPYRVQIQAWSAEAEQNGVSVAAMHTEVRLFVHPDTGKNPNEPWKDPNSLKFGLAPYVVKEPAEGDGEKWYQWKLAVGGFHPGPVDGVWGDDSKRALKEFQRSYPKNNAAPFERLNPDGAMNNDTKEALKRLPANARPLFGNPDNNSDFTSADATTRLNDKDKNIIVWVDDRHYYTEGKAGAMFLGNYHGGMTIGDGIVGIDMNAIARPWISLEADIPLLSKSKGLDSAEGMVNDASRAAVGPCRIDWTFNEIGEDLDAIETGHPDYDKTRIRSRKWVEEVVNGASAATDGKTFRNCPEKNGGKDCGGIRPADLSKYYKAPIGLAAGSLVPWNALDDTTNKTVFSLVYDDVGQQPESLWPRYVGKAGAYLCLSRISGDGYRFRSRVCYDNVSPGNDMPNRAVLKSRYAAPPQAHTAAMRTWRKTSYRGHGAWAPAADVTNHWPALAEGCTRFYKAAHLHFVHEGPNGQPVEHGLNGVISQAEYRNIISTNVVDGHYTPLTITFSLENVWPYCNEPHLGIPQSGLNVTIGDFYDKVFEDVFNKTWRRFREDLLHLFLKKIEEVKGLLKGHLLVEFKSSQAFNVEEYACDACGATRAEVTDNCTPAQLLTGKPCIAPGCHGHMVRNAPPTIDPYDGIPLPAVGVSMGATWLFTSGGASVWAHELGHHRHLEHAQANPSSTTRPAPGGKVAQHDSVVNPDPALPARPTATFDDGSSAADKDRCWDRNCIMSYTNGHLYFCGKCIMKNRGWAVEQLANPGGGLHD